MANMDQFIKSYWEYFLELEEQFFETKRYVDFDKANEKTYSIEYLKLFQAVCSEIDVVAKEVASALNPNFHIDKKTNILKWGFEIQQQFPNIKNEQVAFNYDTTLVPFEKWEYEWATSKDNKRYLKLKPNAENPEWWRRYNDVKHQRIGLVTNTRNFHYANQRNLICALSALFLIEWLYIDKMFNGASNQVQLPKLFSIKK